MRNTGAALDRDRIVERQPFHDGVADLVRAMTWVATATASPTWFVAAFN
jgi:hypothetical protein